MPTSDAKFTSKKGFSRVENHWSREQVGQRSLKSDRKVLNHCGDEEANLKRSITQALGLRQLLP